MVNYNKNNIIIQWNAKNESCSLWKKNNVLRNCYGKFLAMDR